MFKVDSEKSLFSLFRQTTFASMPDDPPKWDGLEIEVADDSEAGWRPLGVYVHVPECSSFGDTLIQLAGKYEDHGEDCLFLQELVAAYMAGKLRYIGDEIIP